MKSKELAVKPNRLIEAGYRLSLVEQRLVLLAITEARRTQKGINGVDFVRITAKDYAEQFETDEKTAYAQIKEARKTLDPVQPEVRHLWLRRGKRLQGGHGSPLAGRRLLH